MRRQGRERRVLPRRPRPRDRGRRAHLGLREARGDAVVPRRPAGQEAQEVPAAGEPLHARHGVRGRGAARAPRPRRHARRHGARCARGARGGRVVHLRRPQSQLVGARALNPVAKRIAELLQARKRTLAVVESSAGGLINAALVAVPGASAYYLGGCVVYTAASREGLLGITAMDMSGIRSASEPYASLIAERVRMKLGATWGLAETGASGPSGNRYGDAPGHACFAVRGPVEAVVTLETRGAEREANMRTFARHALELLQACLEK